jgi:serine/threonine-protein kinase
LGIAHRDIKPDNIYLAQLQDEDGYIVKILDFGVAKMTMASEGGQSGTRTGTLIGTPAYMSPEQARGLSTLDFRTDLYSLGVVAYAMLTGKQAFGAESLGDLLLQICVEPLPSLLAAAPALPPAIDVWFQRACARAPEARFQSAQALAEGLVVASGLSQLQGRMSALVASNTPNGRESGPSLHLPPPSEVIGKSTTGVSALAGDLAEGGPKRSPGLLVALTALLVILGLVVGIAILKSTSSTNQPPPSAVFLVQSASLAPSALPPAIDRIVVETQAVDASSQQAVVPPAPSPGPIKNENEHRRSRDHSRERGVTPTPPPPQVATPPDNNNVGY